jgi:CubicO group peptidase (beta-lactamase class C family)
MRYFILIFCLLFDLSGFGQDLEKLQTFIENESKKLEIPASVVLWVKDGDPVFQCIVNDSLRNSGNSIDIERSLFRVASVSKPFTGLAAMSMIQDGLIDPDADINIYFEKPLLKYRFDIPITVRHLLTHTGGFDDFYINKSTRSKEEIISLEHSVESLMPDQVNIPGEICTYSNYGVALLGLVLEKAAQQEFSQLLAERVFKPMQMYKSTFDPTPDDYPNIVQGWVRQAGDLRPFPLDYIKDAPAGQMLTTVHDILSFMKLITTSEEEAAYNGGMKSLFLSSSEQLFTHNPYLQGGMAALWHLVEYSGHKVVMHDGGYAGVICRLFYFPEHDQALFIFANLMDSRFISVVTDEMIEAFLPSATLKDPAVQIVSDQIEDGLKINDFTGYYRNTRYSRNSMLKISALAGIAGTRGELYLKKEGAHLMMRDHMGNPRRLIRSDTLLFASIDDDYFLGFREQDGKITHVFTSGTSALEKIQFWETSVFQFSLLATSMLVFLIVILVGIGRLLKKVLKRSELDWSITFTYIFSISFTYLVQILLIYWGGLSVETYELEIGFAYGVPNLFYLANVLPFAALGINIFLIYYIIRYIHSGKIWLAGALFSCISVIYFAALHYWNLAGWHF